MAKLERPFVIVQAGGAGTRLRHHTANKPKCLLSVSGTPLLYRLFETFPHSSFVIVGDYKYDVLERFLHTIPPRNEVTLIRAEGKGTLAGLRQAVNAVPNDCAPITIIWSDLLFERPPDVQAGKEPLIGLSDTFRCRWHMNEQGRLVEAPSETRGVAGFFYFPNKGDLKELPGDGEFVRYLSSSKIALKPFTLAHTYELGTIEALEDYQSRRPVSRFFNKVEVGRDAVVKRARDSAFDKLLEIEADWYETVARKGYQHAPKLIRRKPFTIERIAGGHPFELDCDAADKNRILSRIIAAVDALHDLASKAADPQSANEVYCAKPVDRVASVAPLVPNIDCAFLKVNGRHCRNPIHPEHRDWFVDKARSISVDRFSIIHGDPTFSNIIIGGDEKVWLIDPRGYFGNERNFGDPKYDWGKLYYSLQGNYDQFNRKRFKLSIADAIVDVSVQSGGWEATTDLLRERLGDDLDDVKIMHALIWLSLSGYVKDDYDSMLAAFYIGAALLEETES